MDTLPTAGDNPPGPSLGATLAGHDSATHSATAVTPLAYTGPLIDVALIKILGASGGPLVNAAGQVIGMNSAGATSSSSVTAENIGFAISINHAMEIVAQLRATA